MNNRKPPVLRKRSRLLKRGLILLGIVLVAFSAAGLTFNHMFPRQAEAAVRLLPEDTSVALIVDLQPSMGQFMAFRRIYAAAEENGLTKHMDQGLEWLFANTTFGKELQPHLSRSALLAFVGDSPHDYSQGLQRGYVALIGLKDPTAVEKLLKAHSGAPVLSRQLAAATQPVLAVIEDNLVVASDEQTLGRIREVSDGKGKSLQTNHSYKEARRSLDGDANVMLFVSSRPFSEAIQRGGVTGMRDLRAPEWLAAGMAVRDEGLAFSGQIPMNETLFPPYRHLAMAEPLPRDLLKRIPSGAYGFLAVAQPVAFWRMAEEVISETMSDARTVGEIARWLDQATGLNIEADLNSAAEGNWVFASYPVKRDSDRPRGVSSLALLDDANGATPARLVDRAVTKANEFLLSQRYVESQSGYSDGLFRSEEQDGETLHILNYGWQAEVDRGISNLPAESRSMLEGFTVGYATAGEAIIWADQKNLLASAVKSYHSRSDSLDSSSIFRPVWDSALDGAHVCAVIDVVKCATATRNALDSNGNWVRLSDEERRITNKALDIVSRFSSPAYFAMRFNSSSVVSKLFVPIDYDSAIRVLAQEMPAVESIKQTAQEGSVDEDNISRVKQVALAISMYINDHENVFPASMDPSDVERLVGPYVQKPEIFHTVSGEPWNYNPNLAGKSVVSLDSPAETPLLYGLANPDGSDRVVAFADTHATKISESEWRQYYESKVSLDMALAPSGVSPENIAITEDRARKIVADLTGVDRFVKDLQAQGKKPLFDVSPEDAKTFMVHVYEIVDDGDGMSHTATFGWYKVDRSTGEVSPGM